jgi:hypothetical protein
VRQNANVRAHSHGQQRLPTRLAASADLRNGSAMGRNCGRVDCNAACVRADYGLRAILWSGSLVAIFCPRNRSMGNISNRLSGIPLLSAEANEKSSVMGLRRLQCSRVPRTHWTSCVAAFSMTVRSNSALVGDVCAAALRAFFNAPQRER